MLCADTHAEVAGELRWTPEQAERTRDGITVSSVAPSASARAAVGVVMRPDVAAFLREIGGGSALEDGARTLFAGASAAGLLTLPPAASTRARLAGGRAMQRAWLAALARGLAFHPTTVLLCQLEMLDDPRSPRYTAAEVATLRSLERRLFSVFARPPGVAALLFRVARVDGSPERSLRMPPIVDAQRREAVRMTVRIRLARTTDELDQVFALRHRVMVDEEGYMPAQPDGRLFDRFDAYPTTGNVIALVGGRIVGAVRLIERTPAGASADEFFDFRPFLPPAARDVTGGMLVLERAHRDTPRLVFAMMGMGYYWAIGRGATHIIAPANPERRRR